jgi:hypothetical protein
MRWTKDDVGFLLYYFDVAESYAHPGDWKRLYKTRDALVRMIKRKKKKKASRKSRKTIR